MAGDVGGGQDWWGLLYLFLAGVVSIAVDIVRRLSNKIEDLLNDPEEMFGSHQRHHHHRCDDCEEHKHRRWNDPDDEEEIDESEDQA